MTFCLGTPKWDLPRLRLLRLWGAITLRANLWLKWSLKQRCSPCRELSNNMSHAIYVHGNRVDSWLLVVGSQIVNLTPGPSFGHNLCFRCPNVRCDPILDIYVTRPFQWNKKRLNPLRFDLWNRPLKIRKSIGTPTPKVEPFGGVKVHSLTPFHSQEYVVWLPASFLAHNLTNPCLGCEPKARVATLSIEQPGSRLHHQNQLTKSTSQ